MVMWTALTWIATPVLISRMGFNGAALANALVSFTSLVPIFIIRRLFRKDNVHISIIPNVLPSLLAASITGLTAFYLSSQVTNLPSLLGVIGFSGLVYAGLSWLIQGSHIRYHSQTFAKVFKLS